MLGAELNNKILRFGAAANERLFHHSVVRVFHEWRFRDVLEVASPQIFACIFSGVAGCYRVVQGNGHFIDVKYFIM